MGGRASASRPPGRGTRLAEDWQPTPALVARLRHLCPDVDQETEFLSFRAYWLSKAGKDATKVNWELCYEKWILEEQKKAGGRASSPAPRQSALARKVGVAQDLHARLAAREAAETQPTQGVIEGIVM